MAEENLPISPYVLGAWLGDGSTEDAVICHDGGDWEVELAVISEGYAPTRSWVHKETGVHYSRFSRLYTELMGAGLIGNKHIPDCYLRGSIEQRMELLAGLIDTDGSYGEGQYRFINTNERLIGQVAHLARTLGFKVGIQRYEPTTSSSGIEGRRPVYVVVFSPVRRVPCRIPRKQCGKLSEPCRVAITEVRRAEPKLGRCVQVEGGLYCVGENLTPTHNSILCSIYFPAWVLLLWPDTRIALGSYETGFASNFGARVRDVVNRYGPALDVELRTDTKAKSEWAIHKYGGGMVCKGRGGPLTGRPADLLIIDDPIKNAAEAQSQTVLDNLWEWYCTVAYSRLGPRAPVVLIGTRWCAGDLHGRLDAEEKVGGDKFERVHFRAIAKSGDILGRAEGEALWPERVPLARLERVRATRPRWFEACWQGDPMEVQGLHFQPREWGSYSDVGDAWRVRRGLVWHSYRKIDCDIVIALDWAQRGKKDSDRTAFVVAAITSDGMVLVLDVFDDRLRYEENAPALLKYCDKWRPPWEEGGQLVVAGDDDMLSTSMLAECRRYAGIPEVRRLPIQGRGKLVRAQAGIIRSQNGLFLLPEPRPAWFERMADQLAAFTGEDGAEDDIADCFGIIGRVAEEWHSFAADEDDEPIVDEAAYGMVSEANWEDKFS